MAQISLELAEAELAYSTAVHEKTFAGTFAQWLQQFHPMLGGKPPSVFTHARWAALLKDEFFEVERLANLKGGEYSGDSDRLANFRRNAEALGLDYRQVWAVYAAKHWDAIMQSIKDLATGTKRPRLESLQGRCRDLITYLLLFEAMLLEQDEPTGLGYPVDAGQDTSHG